MYLQCRFRLAARAAFILGLAVPWLASAQIIITNGVQTYSTLNGATVVLSNRCELRVTDATTPLSGCLINLNSPDAYCVVQNIKPSVVAATYLPQFRINGAGAVVDSNCRVVQYGMGAVVVPHNSTFQPLQVFPGPHFTGTAASLSQYVYYKGTGLGAMNATISSFKLKRGYMATFAQTESGTGLSKCYVAQDGDLEVSLLPPDFDNSVRFVYVLPWRWVSKKGVAGDPGNSQLNVQSWYNWNIDQNSSRDLEYVPIRQQRWWPGLGQDWKARGANTLLGYNEPDHTDQANIAVGDAIYSWPDLLGTGLRLGSPAPSDGGYSSWLYPFLTQADAANLRVDFVAVHYYRCTSPVSDPNAAATQMYNALKGIYDTTKRPLWVTEWNNGANWTGCGDPTYAQQQAAVAAIITMLDTTPFVERYQLYNWVEDVRAVVTNGVLTPAGITYRDKQSPLGYMQALPDNGTRSSAQLQFENNTLDTAGFGNNGVSSGSPAYTNGHSGQALVFDGANTVVTLPPNIAGSNAFSFAAWVKWDGGANWQRIFDFGNSTTHYLFLSPNASGSNLRFAIKNGGSEQIVQTTAMPVGIWQHVAVTLSGTTARLYVNGAQVAVNTGMSILPSTFNPHVNFLGKSQFPADPMFKGVLDEVLIADTALSAAQIAALQTNAPPQFTNNVLAGALVTQGQPYAGSLAGTAADPDGDTLTYSKIAGPVWLTVGGGGALSGTPTGNDGGTNFFTVRVTDLAGNAAFAVWPVVVQSPLTGGPALLARYAFDGNASDSSGNAFHGTLAGSSAYVAGKFGSALDLDGSSHSVTLPASLLAGVSNFTVAAWVNWDGGNAWQRIFDFGNDTTHYLFLSPGSGSGTLRFAINNGSGEQMVETSGLATGQWQHLAVTRNGNLCRLYRNGTVVASSAAVTLSPANFNPAVNYLGKSQFPDPLFNGRMDELFLYNYALSDAEVVRLMNNQPPPPVAPTILASAFTGNTLTLTWPTNYLGCRLESNSVSLAVPGAWFPVSGSGATNQMFLPLDAAASNVFFRLVYP